MTRAAGDGAVRAIAIVKFIKAFLLFGFDLGALRLLPASVASHAEQWIVALAWHLDRHAVPALEARLAGLHGGTLVVLEIASFLYAGLFVVEGAGLWGRRVWAEYLTIVATSLLIPFEVFELLKRATAPRLLALGINLLVVAYLAVRARRRIRGAH